MREEELRHMCLLVCPVPHRVPQKFKEERGSKRKTLLLPGYPIVEQVALMAKYEQSFDLSSVKEIAESVGMAQPSESQICYIDLPGSDQDPPTPRLSHRLAAQLLFRGSRRTRPGLRVSSLSILSISSLRHMT